MADFLDEVLEVQRRKLWLTNNRIECFEDVFMFQGTLDKDKQDDIIYQNLLIEWHRRYPVHENTKIQVRKLKSNPDFYEKREKAIQNMFLNDLETF